MISWTVGENQRKGRNNMPSTALRVCPSLEVIRGRGLIEGNRPWSRRSIVARALRGLSFRRSGFVTESDQSESAAAAGYADAKLKYPRSRRRPDSRLRVSWRLARLRRVCRL